MKQILLSLGILLLLSTQANASLCGNGKMTIKEWVKKDGTYLDYNLPKEVFNGKACFLKPYEGKTLQSTKEFHNIINKALYSYRKREVSLTEFTKVLEELGNNFDLYLIKPCDMGPTPIKGCENSLSVILGYVSESLVTPGKKSFSAIDAANYIEE